MINMSLTYLTDIKYNDKNQPIETNISLFILNDGTNEGIAFYSFKELFDALEELCEIMPIRIFVYDLKNFFSYIFYYINEIGLPKSDKKFDKRKRKNKLPKAYFVRGTKLNINKLQLRLSNFYIDFVGLNKYKMPEDANLLEFGNKIEQLYEDIFDFNTIPSYAAFKFTKGIFKFKENYPQMDLNSAEYKSFDSLRNEYYSTFGGSMFSLESSIYKNCVKYDRNSMYPSILYYEMLPYGFGKYIENPLDTDYESSSCIRFYHIKTLKGRMKLNVIAGCGDNGNIIMDDIWIYDFVLTEILKDAEIDEIDIGEAYEYHTKSISKNASSFIMKLYNDRQKYKEEYGSNSAEAIITKLILNSIYGKFGQKPLLGEYDYKINDDGIIVAEFEKTEEIEMPKYTYLPLAAFIVQKGWQIMMNIGYHIGEEHIHYVDTDCFIMDDLPECRNIIESSKWKWCGKGNRLGQWKLEDIIEEVSIKGIKQYAYVNKDGDFEEANCGGGKHDYYDGLRTFDNKSDITIQTFIKGGAIYNKTERGNGNE